MNSLFNLVSFFKRKNKGQTVKAGTARSKKVSEPKQSSGRLAAFLAVVLLTLFCSTILAFSIRGNAGNPTPVELNTLAWKDNGPLELSPERGRYALLYSLTENNSFTFTQPIAAFAAPDVGYQDGKYISLFAPGVSYLVIPGYVAGKAVGLAQVGTFAVVGLFALFNFFLIRAIAIHLGANKIPAAIGGMAFLFASPAFSYAVTLYQHHISTFLILMSIYLLLRSRSVYSLIAIWIMCGASIAVDYPNFFMMLPIGVYALARTFIVEKQETITKVSAPLMRVLATLAIAIPLSLFFAFNQVSNGSPLTLSGSVERAIEVKADGKPVLEAEITKRQLEKEGNQNVTVEEKNVSQFFKPRDMINGFYTHLLSFDRGILLYTPVMLFGIAGMIVLRKHKKYVALAAGVVGFNVVLYSMWGDPYGGWAFGSRYLIPTYAILAIFIATLITQWNKQILFLILFFLMFSYSVSVNTLGAITSNRNPPRVETQALEQKSGKKEEFTYVRNMHMLDAGVSKSFIFQTYAKNSISAWTYYLTLIGSIIVVSAVMLTYQTLQVYSKSSSHAKATVKSTVPHEARKEHYAV